MADDEEARALAGDGGGPRKMGPAVARSGAGDERAETIPVRILNEYVYCPRLAYLEWVQGEWADNADTEEGRLRHRAVDAGGGRLEAPEPEGLLEGVGQVRSVHLSAPAFGITTRIDLVEVEDGAVVPIDYKRGRVPDIPDGAWPPERVQVCAQGLVLRANGYRSDHGFLYFVESKRRVRVDFDEALVAATHEAIEGARRLPVEEIPPPLVDSPKCPRCSLVGICLPDEVQASRGADGEPRLLVPARDDALPLYVQMHGQRVGVRGEEIVVAGGGEKHAVRMLDTSQICLFGNVQVSAPAVKTLCERDIAVAWFSQGGWFYGLTRGMATKNVHLRIAQHRVAAQPERALLLARTFIRSKIRNARTLLRRNHPDPDRALDALKAQARAAERAASLPTLLGVEGTAARDYFAIFDGMLKQDEVGGDFKLDGRNRRPPTDPLNALLSFAYALLTKDWTLTLYAVGFDPFVGFLHQPRHGRPALALDLMEEFRPIIADSVVVTAVNNRVVRPEHFVRCGPAVNLNKAGRAAFIKAYERRMDELVTHPVFGYRISYRRVLEVQARLLGRHLEGELDAYPAFETR